MAAALERRGNAKLEALGKLEKAYADAQRQAHFTVSGEEKRALKQLAQDLPARWHAPTTTDAARKQVLRYALAEVQLDGVTTPGKITIRRTWHSGAVTERQSERLQVGAGAPRTDVHIIERSRALAPTHTVADISECLNRDGLRSAQGCPVRDYHVLYIARRHHIPVTTGATHWPRALP